MPMSSAAAEAAQVGDHRVLPRARSGHARGVHAHRHEHADRYSERYVPSHVHGAHHELITPTCWSSAVAWPDCGLRSARGAAATTRSSCRWSRPSARIQGGARRYASLARQCLQGTGRQRGRALRGHRARLDWGADQEVVRMFVNTAPKAVRELAAWAFRGRASARATGRSSSMARRSPSPREPRPTACFRSAISAEPRSGAPATSRTEPATQCSPPWRTRRSPQSIPVHERTEALALIHDGGRCYGAVVRDLITGELRAYVAKATAITTRWRVASTAIRRTP